MDCRTSLCLLIGFSFGIIGCQGKRTMPIREDAPQVVTSKKESKKRQPRAETCVTFGDFRLQESKNKELSESAKKKMLDEARVAYEQALALDAKNIAAHRGLAEVYNGYGLEDRAVEILDAGIKIAPQDPILWMTKGMYYARQKQWDAAIQAMQEAVRYAPNDRQTNQTLGFCLARSGRLDESMVILKKIMPEAEASYNIARMLHHTNNPELSRKYAQYALKGNPQLMGPRRLIDKIEQELESKKPASDIQRVDHQTR